MGETGGDRDTETARRNGLMPLVVIAALLVAVYAAWGALGRRPRPDPFGPWSDAHQVAPDPPALPGGTGESGPAVFDEGDDEIEDEAR